MREITTWRGRNKTSVTIVIIIIILLLPHSSLYYSFLWESGEGTLKAFFAGNALRCFVYVNIFHFYYQILPSPYFPRYLTTLASFLNSTCHTFLLKTTFL